jgi:hypothetical protein
MALRRDTSGPQRSWMSEKGFRVVDLWTSEEVFRRFGEKLMPILQGVGIEGQPEIYQAHTFVSAGRFTGDAPTAEATSHDSSNLNSFNARSNAADKLFRACRVRTAQASRDAWWLKHRFRICRARRPAISECGNCTGDVMATEFPDKPAVSTTPFDDLAFQRTKDCRCDRSVRAGGVERLGPAGRWSTDGEITGGPFVPVSTARDSHGAVLSEGKYGRGSKPLFSFRQAVYARGKTATHGGPGREL